MADNAGIFTVQGLLYAVLTGGSFAGFITVLGAWLAKRSELRHADARRDLAERQQERVDYSAAQVQERIDIRKAYQDIIESLKDRIQDSERDRERLWANFREMQVALAECENLHRDDQRLRQEDSKEIAVLKRQNQEQAAQISDLQRRIPGANLGPGDE